MICFLVAAFVVSSLCSAAANHFLTARVLARVGAEFSEAERTHREERAALLRAVVARSPAELASLTRADAQAEASRVGHRPEPRRQISAEEFDAMLRQDMEKGLGGEPQPILEGF